MIYFSVNDFKELDCMKILVTGGAGYIGSHTCVELLNAGYDVCVADNLSNSHAESLNRVRTITGRSPLFVKSDICDKVATDRILDSFHADCVIHFAGLKAVGESVKLPIEYYRNNIVSTLSLVQSMKEHGVKNIVFSSSATVYTGDNEMPLRENSHIGYCTNPYGWTKYMQEEMFRSFSAAESDLSVVLLRYFNPVGAHESGLIGEDPQGIPNNLLPYVSQVAVGRRDHVTVFGNDYDTPDGTGVRDYIHVTDLARAHLLAVDFAVSNKGCDVFNVGTGKGSSVLEMIDAFSKACGHKVPYQIGPRRPGDLASVWCDPTKAEKILNFKAMYNLDDMCASAWKWQSSNPTGYIS